ncbi:MAG TPA: carboxymuconolactone decarboxylase family protein, partial [Burkholderiales bacterium]|nr:carboxymuconolactone decarboxylase family protein [Burkholderiales bacterium]
MQDALYRKGKKIRARVLGEGREAEIARTEDAFSMPLREFSTRYVWGELWSRKGLPLKTRSLINVALLTVLKCEH